MTIGILHDTHTNLEKSLKDIVRDALNHIFDVCQFFTSRRANTLFPSSTKTTINICSFIGTRVILVITAWWAGLSCSCGIKHATQKSGNRSKCFNTYLIILGLHPGTADSNLSNHFKKMHSKISFTPEYLCCRMY